MRVTFAVAVASAVVGAGQQAGTVVVVVAVVEGPEALVGRSERGAYSVPNLRGRVLVDPCRISVRVFLRLV